MFEDDFSFDPYLVNAFKELPDADTDNILSAEDVYLFILEEVGELNTPIKPIFKDENDPTSLILVDVTGKVLEVENDTNENFPIIYFLYGLYFNPIVYFYFDSELNVIELSFSPEEVEEANIVITLSSTRILSKLNLKELVLIPTSTTERLNTVASLKRTINLHKANPRTTKVYQKRINKVVDPIGTIKRSRSSKLMWKKHRFKILLGMSRFNNSVKGKQFHKALGAALKKEDSNDYLSTTMKTLGAQEWTILNYNNILIVKNINLKGLKLPNRVYLFYRNEVSEQNLFGLLVYENKQSNDDLRTLLKNLITVTKDFKFEMVKKLLSFGNLVNLEILENYKEKFTKEEINIFDSLVRSKILMSNSTLLFKDVEGLLASIKANYE